MKKFVKRLLCLFVWHTRFTKMAEYEYAPFGIGTGENEHYPMWPCDGCHTIYIELETKNNRKLL